MKLKQYLKDSILVVIYFCVILLIVDLVLISSTPISKSIKDIIYLNVLLIIVSAFFLKLGYNRWKENYKELYDALNNGENIDLISVKADKLEGRLIKDIIDIKNKEVYNKSNSFKKEVNDINEYLTKWVHEIKIPVSVCELITDRIEDSFDDTTNISNNLRGEIARIKFLIDQVLYAGRASSYSEDLLINEVSLKKVISEVIKKNSFFFISKQIDLKVNNVNFNVMTDRKWIGYILEQIINNACKYVEKNGNIEIYCEENEKAIMLHIKDSGIGILPKDIARIFDKGFTGNNGRLNTKSTGMGLYFSKKMSQKLNHDIKVTSEINKYTEFTIVFYKLSDYFITN